MHLEQQYWEKGTAVDVGKKVSESKATARLALLIVQSADGTCVSIVACKHSYRTTLLLRGSSRIVAAPT